MQQLVARALQETIAVANAKASSSGAIALAGRRLSQTRAAATAPTTMMATWSPYATGWRRWSLVARRALPHGGGEPARRDRHPYGGIGENGPEPEGDGEPLLSGEPSTCRCLR